MKTILSLAVVLSAILFVPRSYAGPIHKHATAEHPQVANENFLFEAVENSTNVESQSEHKMHCNWVSASGESCAGPSSVFIPPSSPVNPTPEPAPILLFGTVILGAFVLTRIRS